MMEAVDNVECDNRRSDGITLFDCEKIYRTTGETCSPEIRKRACLTFRPARTMRFAALCFLADNEVDRQPDKICFIMQVWTFGHLRLRPANGERLRPVHSGAP